MGYNFGGSIDPGIMDYWLGIVWGQGREESINALSVKEL